MITLDPIAGNILKITVPEKLKSDDFATLAPKIDTFIRQHGVIRLLVDASNFHGWENTAAFDKHMGFVKSHHKSVERIAAIAGHHWLHWVAGVIRIFVHPEIRIFDKDKADEALEWVTNQTGVKTAA